MIGQDMVNRLYDCQVIDPQGEKIGSVKRVWLDGQTGDPVWASVHTGLFGLKETFVPLQRAELTNDQLQVPVAKDQVKDAPRIEAEGDEMSDDEQQTLYRYYGVTPGGSTPDQRRGERRSGRQDERARGEQRTSAPGGRRDQEQRQGMSQPGSVQRSGGMTRAEEQLRVGTEQVETGRVRLVKHVVTEQQQVNVPVTHEEVRIEREPISGTDARDVEIGEGEQEIRLHAEKPVVSKETVPVERVRLGKETVTEQQTVSDQVRREEIDVQGDTRRGDHGRRPR